MIYMQNLYLSIPAGRRWGAAYVVLPALGTLGLAWLQYLGLKKSPAVAPAHTVAAV